ncbi:MAG: hypothetical protein GX607_11610 [Myxococcales bacterium]|nr:hypothetical protein [Myxococcales bacterium]
MANHVHLMGLCAVVYAEEEPCKERREEPWDGDDPARAALESELQRRFASGAKRKEAARTIHAEYGRLLEEELAEAELAQGEVEHLSLESHLHQSWAAP